ncbi:MAG TPA: glycosyltransferase, partial [Bryobacteraceae bacterium]|nr:glycosyltransferase [Bryobacteraceae bacterium]
MRLSVVIPNWNGLRVLPALLDDLRRQTLTADEVIVVDNGSSDGSDNAAEAWGARVIRFRCNRGFAQAVNSGVAAAQADTVAILNNDLRLSEGWVAAIRSGLRDEHCFA